MKQVFSNELSVDVDAIAKEVFRLGSYESNEFWSPAIMRDGDRVWAQLVERSMQYNEEVLVTFAMANLNDPNDVVAHCGLWEDQDNSYLSWREDPNGAYCACESVSDTCLNVYDETNEEHRKMKRYSFDINMESNFKIQEIAEEIESLLRCNAE